MSTIRKYEDTYFSVKRLKTNCALRQYKEKKHDMYFVFLAAIATLLRIN